MAECAGTGLVESLTVTGWLSGLLCLFSLLRLLLFLLLAFRHLEWLRLGTVSVVVELDSSFWLCHERLVGSEIVGYVVSSCG